MNNSRESEDAKVYHNNLDNGAVDEQLKDLYWNEKNNSTALCNNNNSTNIIKQPSCLDELVSDVEYPDLEFTKDGLRRLTIKRDLRILPLVCLFYLFSVIDRVNIGTVDIL